MKPNYAIIEEIDDILPLYSRYLNGLPSPYSAYSVLESLVELPDYFAIGVYPHRDMLVGFIDGYRLTDKVHRMLNVYKGDATTNAMVGLQKAYEAEIVRRGYQGWFSQSAKHTDSILEKLGGKQWA